LNQQFVWDSFRVSPLYRFNHLDRSTNTRVYSEHFYEEGHLSGLTDQDRQHREQRHRLSADFSGKTQGGGSYTGFANLNYFVYDQSGRELRDRTGIINSLEREDKALDGRSLQGGGQL